MKNFKPDRNENKKISPPQAGKTWQLSFHNLTSDGDTCLFVNSCALPYPRVPQDALLSPLFDVANYLPGVLVGIILYHDQPGKQG